MGGWTISAQVPGPDAGVACAVAALALWSWSSEQQPGTDQNLRYAHGLLALSAALRLAGQAARTDIVASLTRAIDAYALATLAGLRQHRRAMSPLWLSVLTASSLPLERVARRLVGYGLQQLSASSDLLAGAELRFQLGVFALALAAAPAACWASRLPVSRQAPLSTGVLDRQESRQPEVPHA